MSEHTAESDAPDCRCAVPKPDWRGNCQTCGRFACEYADRGKTRCDMCDCFIDLYPDSPRALHPEAFIVGRVIPPGGCTTPGCPGDARYAAPGRRHIEGCTYPIPPESSAS